MSQDIAFEGDDAGPVLANERVRLGYARALLSWALLGARLGYGVRGGSSFFPWSAETYFGVGKLWVKRGFVPYAAIRSGFMEVDAKVGVSPTEERWESIGPGFAGLDGGVAYAFNPALRAKVEVATLVGFPDLGFVVEGSLGVGAGF